MEITQNMSLTETVSTEARMEGDDTVVINTARPGGFVVCNPTSLSLGHLPLGDERQMKEKIAAVVCTLDNAIDSNFYPTPFAWITNHRYRNISLGVGDYHYALALRGTRWGSVGHLGFIDKIFERINYVAIEASTGPAKEERRYVYSEESSWRTGAYFTKHGYDSLQWKDLVAEVTADGMGNAYLLAITPISSISIIAETTAETDPVMKRFFLEEKKGVTLPRAAPLSSNKTYRLHKGTYRIDQTWSVRVAGTRQSHIDQVQSLNLYITNDFTMRQVLSLYLLVQEYEVETVCYVRSKSLEVEECKSCTS